MSVVVLASSWSCGAEPVDAELEVSSLEVDFGTLEINGLPIQRAVALKNRGTLDLEVVALDFVSSSPDLTMLAPTDRTIAGQSLLTVRFAYAPRSSDEVSGSLVVATAAGDQTIRVKGRGGTRAYRVERPSATCAGNAQSISLGTGDGRSPLTQTVRVIATGTGPIEVSSFLESNAEGLAITSSASATIGPGETRDVTITYDPSFPGAVDSAILLRTNSQASPGERIPICGDAHFAKLCAPDGVDLGVVSLGMPLNGRVDLSNCGDRPLTVQSIALATDSAHPGSPGFSVTSSAPLMLPPAAVMQALVDLSLTSYEPHRAFLHVITDAPKGPQRWIPMEGRAVQPCTLVASPSMIELNGRTRPSVGVRFTNVGAEFCTVENVLLRLRRDEFELEGPVYPVIVPPGFQFGLSLTYRPPPGGGVMRYELEVVVRDAPPLIVPVTADSG